ncbi:hypothetical protein C9I98_08045 [Photobacterium sanctipauli]|uniref:Ion channel protein Tsx n=2 Tax=Photobacterium sanctipauli TaxID=1342794 RepID=A0A2T3NX50_9GAMM|nr:outer membrane protein OmpK [Photobacterium sanctipauli]PSW20779.1 hypothetical protein C9I98_08045 [Photobacterium sanctipauli]
MNKLLKGAAIASCLLSSAVSAEQLYGWGNVHVDYQFWDQGFVDDNDFRQALIGVEGGAGYDWGELYGFYDYEGVDKATGNRGQTFNGEAHIYLGDSGASLFGKVYGHIDQNIREVNQYMGFGYTGLTGDNWWFKPWAAVEFINVSNEFNAGVKDYTGMNGGTIGWQAGYAFEAFGESFLLHNWNQIELFRSDEYAENNYGDTGLNGAVNFAWNINEDFTAMLMYRYFVNKLGADGYGDILIYRLAYNF